MSVVMEIEPQVKDGIRLVVNDDDAMQLILAYVPEYGQGLVTYQEAYDLALIRDEQAAYDLEANIMALGSNADDEAETAAARDAINALLETAALADAEVIQVMEAL